jgi:uncharacterized cupredoxin-like copper-binding protein
LGRSPVSGWRGCEAVAYARAKRSDNAKKEGDVAKFRLTLAALVSVLGLAAPAVSAGASTPVEVSMRDPSSGPGIAGMQMTTQAAQVPAGTVTFHAKNESKTLVHEVLVVKVPGFNVNLPYNPKTSAVVEGSVDKLGEIPDLRPGASGSLALALAPGDYLLLCNQPEHYKGGIWTRFAVSR